MTTRSRGRADAPVRAAERGPRAKWWRRQGSKEQGFRYVDRHGRAVTDQADLERIRGLAIPPAWRHVRIAPSPRSRIQAVGVDNAGRVQYRYHPKYQEKQEREKYAKVERFGHHLPALRRVSNRHLDDGDALTRERVLAAVVRLINDLYVRVGSDEHTKRSRTYGITTFRNRHLEIKSGGRLVFKYKGKSGIRHRHVLVDEDLAAVMEDLKGLGGPRLFEYVDEEGAIRPITRQDVNAYIKEATAPEFSSKDYRTWGGSLMMAVRLAEIGCADTEREAKKNVTRAVKDVAQHLGNTPAVCRQSYVHPVVLERYLGGVTLDEFRSRKKRCIIACRQPEYEPEERALLRMLDATRNGTA